MIPRPRSVTPDELIGLLLELDSTRRHLIAITGSPGSGKSTLSDALAARLNGVRPSSAAVVPMDGFHYDDAVLKAHGTLPRKGAPHTFDVDGLIALIQRLRANEEPAIAVPLFDRALEISRAAARLVPRATPLVLVEGNYLLIDQAPWSALRPLFDLTVHLVVPEAELERRLIDRWLRQGLPQSAAETRARGNDLVNARLVTQHSAPADIEISTP